MKKVKITARAASLVDEWARLAAKQLGPGFVPVIMWQVDDSSSDHFVPQLTIGLERRDVVDRSRVMECEGNEVEIYQYVPDELFGEGAQKFVDRKNNGLVLTEEADADL